MPHQSASLRVQLHEALAANKLLQAEVERLHKALDEKRMRSTSKGVSKVICAGWGHDWSLGLKKPAWPVSMEQINVNVDEDVKLAS